MLMKRRKKLINKHFMSSTRDASRVGYKNRNYKIICTRFGRARPIKTIQPVISKYG